MGAAESRIDTVIVGSGAAAAVAFFWAVYGPALLAAAPGSSFRPMALAPLLAFVLGYGWWMMCIVMGVRQLFVRPRRYGLVTISCGIVQFLAVPLAAELLMRARGIAWGS